MESLDHTRMLAAEVDLTSGCVSANVGLRESLGKVGARGLGVEARRSATRAPGRCSKNCELQSAEIERWKNRPGRASRQN